MAGRRANLDDIAKACGVSKGLVSSVLRGANASAVRCSVETKDRIFECARSLDYSPNLLAKAFAKGSSPLVAVSLRVRKTDSPELVNFYLNDNLMGISGALRKHGFYMVYLPYESAQEQLEQVKGIASSGLAGGLIANFARDEEEGLASFLRDEQFPHVILGSPTTSIPLVSYEIDFAPLREFCRKQASLSGFSCVSICCVDESARLCLVDGLGRAIPFEPGDEASLASGAVFASGFECHERLLSMGLDLAGRLWLVEDCRFRGKMSKPAVLVRSGQSKRAWLCAELLAKWILDGVAPELKPYSASFVESDMEALT